MAEKTRFSARVKTDTLDTIDDHSDETGLNRSATIDQIVEEWEQGDDRSPDARRFDQLDAVGSVLGSATVGLGVLALLFLGLTLVGGPVFLPAAESLLTLTALALSLQFGLVFEQARALKRLAGIGLLSSLRLYVTVYLGLSPRDALPEPLQRPQEVR
jgi:hypothetical protein